MIRLILSTLVLLFTIESFSQGFSQLGCSEKMWVVLHPFSASKARRIAKKAIELTDSVSNTKDWLKLNSGGRKDAFRHGIWMAMMSAEIGPKRAMWLGKSHEKKNVKDFKRGRLEEGQVPDQKAVEMDLFNNKVGVDIGQLDKNNSSELIIKVLDYIESGKFRVIKMDDLGNSIDQEGKVIQRDQWEGHWLNERVLVKSN